MIAAYSRILLTYVLFIVFSVWILLNSLVDLIMKSNILGAFMQVISIWDANERLMLYTDYLQTLKGMTFINRCITQTRLEVTFIGEGHGEAQSDDRSSYHY